MNILHAEVTDSSANGFTIKDVINISASPKKVYQNIVNIGLWWSSTHTYSGNSNNLFLEDKTGGCLCEKLDGGGSVQHMIVALVIPDKIIRLLGGLGPLQALGVNGSLTFSLSQSGSGTELEVTYAVGGYSPGGLQQLASPVDRVLFEQLTRLKNQVENGKPG